MNTQHHDDLEQLLGRELHGRVDGMHDAPLGFSDVRGRAGRIQRNRRIAVGTGVAAAVAVIVPTAVMAGSGLGGPNPDVPAATQTDEPRPAPTPQADGSFALTFDGIPTGAPADVPYISVEDQVLVNGDETIGLPEVFSQITPYGDGWVALSGGDRSPTGYEVVELDADFTEVRRATAGTGLAVSPDGSRVSWVESAGGSASLVNAATAGGEESQLGISSVWSKPVGFLADGAVVYGEDESDGQPDYKVATTDGDVTPIDGFLWLDGASPTNGLVAGMTDYRNDGTSCSGVTDPLSDDGLLWETCDYTLGEFSADGRFVIGFATQYDGPGSPTLSILDASTGESVVDFRPPRSRSVVGISQATWEDDDSVVGIFTDATDQAILRFDLDGRLEQASRMAHPDGLEVDLWFAEQNRG